MALLHRNGTTVYLVSGGFRSLIEPMADFLDIPRKNVFANRILFNELGMVPVIHSISAMVGSQVAV